MASRSRILLTVLILVGTLALTSSAQRRPRERITLPIRTPITGTVYDFDTREPIPFATVQIVGSSLATTANENGQYRLLVNPGTHEIKFSHIAYYSERVAIEIAENPLVQDAHLHPALMEIRGQRVYDRAADPAEQIILEAISRKQDILSKLHDYSFDAYTKLVVRDRSKPDSTNFFIITETQVTAFWEQPDKQKEIITARRQSKNLPAEANLVSVGEILNFNKNRIEIGDQQVVSPTANDALDHYHYYLLDTTMMDGRPVFVLEIEPETELRPLFKGTIHIADSTYDVVAVDVTFSGLDVPLINNARYGLRYAQFRDEYWLPVEIRFSGDVNFGVKIPGIPSALNFAYVASLSGYTIEEGIPNGTFGEVVLEVDEIADNVDSATWAARQTIPLTRLEQRGYEIIDSVESAPKPLPQQLLRIAAGLAFLATTQDQFFHFNRAEGPYVGAGWTFGKLLPNTSIWARGGYAFDAEYWQYRIGTEYTVSPSWPVTIWAEYHDDVEHRPTIFLPPGINMTIPALSSKVDPYDYFAERGFEVYGTTKVVNHTRLTFGYTDFRQSSLGTNNDWSLFNRDDTIRQNPGIIEGKLRAAVARFTWDSRPLVRRKRRDTFSPEPTYTQLNARVEYSSPDVLNSDFDFTKYSVSLLHRHRLFGLGITAFYAYWGESDGELPPQRYFTVEFSPLSITNAQGFQTLHETNFGGSRVLSISARHNFGRQLWVASRIPGVEKIPFHLSIFGGAFWADFDGHTYVAGDESIRTARSAYSEAGFGLGNLTPFLAPFNLELDFTWQLSEYETTDFTMSWGFGF